MIHFFVTFSPDANNSPFGAELRRLGIPFQLFSGMAQLPFQRGRGLMLLSGYMRLIRFALQKTVQSIVSKPRPDVVVLGSDVEVLVYSCLRMLLPWQRPKIVLLGFIYTARRSSFYSKLRIAYYRLVLSNCALVICHSRLELQRYANLFPGSAQSFVFIPFGGYVYGWDQESVNNAEKFERRAFRIFSAGRSGRDYQTLALAADGESFDVTLASDSREAVGDIVEKENLRILRDCYGGKYLHELRSCDAVVIPLAVENISAGQMVIVQAMAYGKPVVVTRTPTIEDYISHEREGLMVRPGDAEDLRRAINRLRDDPSLYSRLRKAARAAYEERYSQGAYIRNLVNAIETLQ